MLKCKAVDKLKDSSGVTIGYIITDGTNNMSVKSKDIKAAILRGDVEIENLHINSAGRLVKKGNENNTTSPKKKHVLNITNCHI